MTAGKDYMNSYERPGRGSMGPGESGSPLTAQQEADAALARMEMANVSPTPPAEVEVYKSTPTIA
jgi:hypothetical protein